LELKKGGKKQGIMDLDDFAHQCVLSLNLLCMNHLPSSLISPNMNLEFNYL